jgi:hypothetical protein
MQYQRPPPQQCKQHLNVSRLIIPRLEARVALEYSQRVLE